MTEAIKKLFKRHRRQSGLTPKEVQDKTGYTYRQVYRTIERLVKGETLARVSRGHYRLAT